MPYISDEFHSLKDIRWYGSVYLMAVCMSQLLFSKPSARYSIRWIYGAAMFVFLVGSAVCGAAPNSPALNAGRAIAGFGSSGLLVTAFSLVPSLAPPPKRFMLLSLISIARSIAATCGPLIGGALTQRFSLRWNFYINLPLAFTSFSDLLQTLDLTGLAALVPCVVCILLALQWGGVQYRWGDGRIIALLILFGVLGLVFIVIEFCQGEKPMLPSHISIQRNVSCTSFYAFCTSGAIYMLTYYLPIWFQGVKEASPLMSAVNTLPWLITSVITLLGGGALISKLGHADPFMFVGSGFGAVGSGLFTTFTPGTSESKWIDCQIIFAIGSAFFSVTLLMMMGSSIFVSVAQALFTNNLASGLQRLGISGVDVGTVSTTGVTSITQGLSENVKRAVLCVINNALVQSWRVPIVLSCISIVGALAVEHRKSKPKDGA